MDKRFNGQMCAEWVYLCLSFFLSFDLVKNIWFAQYFFDSRTFLHKFISYYASMCWNKYFKMLECFRVSIFFFYVSQNHRTNWNQMNWMIDITFESVSCFFLFRPLVLSMEFVAMMMCYPYHRNWIDSRYYWCVLMAYYQSIY